MKISDGQPKVSDSLKISDFSDSLGVLQHPQTAWGAAAPPSTPSNTPMRAGEHNYSIHTYIDTGWAS